MAKKIIQKPIGAKRLGLVATMTNGKVDSSLPHIDKTGLRWATEKV